MLRLRCAHTHADEKKKIIMQLIISLNAFFFFPDLQFPIDLSGVEKDHPFLEKVRRSRTLNASFCIQFSFLLSDTIQDQLQALYRRLVILNRSAALRLDGQHSRNVNNNVSCKFKNYQISFPTLARHNQCTYGRWLYVGFFQGMGS